MRCLHRKLSDEVRADIGDKIAKISRFMVLDAHINLVMVNSQYNHIIRSIWWEIQRAKGEIES